MSVCLKCSYVSFSGLDIRVFEERDDKVIPMKNRMDGKVRGMYEANSRIFGSP
jgi:hypothetical protein